jgi:hypothetical protein
MTRIRQFANDMGISYNKAKNLVQKGKNRKDGGSTILENTMQKTKMMKAADGKITKLRKETSPKAKMGNFRNIVNAAVSGKMSPKEAEKAIRKIVISKKEGGATEFGMLSVKAGIDKNPKPTQADRIAGAKMKDKKPMKKAMGGLKDVPSGNKGKGLSMLPTEVRNKMGFKKKGGTMKMMGGGAMNMMPRRMMKKGGIARGGGAATSGTGFKGVY